MLASGSDYPIKSASYIYNYFNSRYPTNYIAQAVLKDISDKSRFKKLGYENRDNWWLSFERSKCKVEIKPFRYIRIRCIHKIKDVPFLQIFRKIPLIIKLFFSKSRIGEVFKSLDWVISETWMELSSETILKLLDWLEKNPNYLELGKYCHNPEEMLLQSVINTIEKSLPRKSYLVNCEARSIHGGSLEIENDDWNFVNEKINNKDWLFMRKFSYQRNSELLERIDTIINEKGL